MDKIFKKKNTEFRVYNLLAQGQTASNEWAWIQIQPYRRSKSMLFLFSSQLTGLSDKTELTPSFFAVNQGLKRSHLKHIPPTPLLAFSKLQDLLYSTVRFFPVYIFFHSRKWQRKECNNRNMLAVSDCSIESSQAKHF